MSMGLTASQTASIRITAAAHASTPRQVRVDAVGHRHRGTRYARPVACRHNLRLELGAMGAPAPAPSDDFVGDSVHVSTKNLVDTSILKPSATIKVPRQDAYDRLATVRDDRAQARRSCPRNR